MEYLLHIGISFAIAIPLAKIWIGILDRQMRDPRWQEHRDDPDYWGWP